ncbi:MAG: beta-N-acetylhexosaminidase, partial [Flavitalea sp.]
MNRVASMYIRKISLSAVFMVSIFFSFTVNASDRPLIFPLPQSAQLTNDKFVLDKTVSIIIPVNATQNDISLARLLIAELSDKYGLSVTIENKAVIPASRKSIIIGAFSNPLIKKYFSDNKLALTAKNPGAEGYVLEVKANSIVIGGSDNAGAFYGLQSLRQLIDAGNGTTIQGIKVRDWPNLPVRAIRLYVPGPQNMAFFKRFMKNFMSLYKFNKVVMEFNCMRLDKHPEVNTGWELFARYMTYTRSTETLGIHGETKNSTHYDAGDGFIIEKEAVKDIVKYANENFIEVIPEIPSLSHSYYLLANHPELAEYPGDNWPDTYCPSNPNSYKLLFDVYDEYIDVIKPKMIHIGHDEWRGAPIGVCPRCKDKDYSVLYANDVNKIHSYLAAKGIKTAMWGDFFVEKVRGAGPQDKVATTGMKYQLPGALPPSLVKKSIPKDILVFNWFWDGEDNVNDKQLNDWGFTQFYGNLEPVIKNWSAR